MTSAQEKRLAISQDLYFKVETLARELNVKPSDFITAAIEAHIRRAQVVSGPPANDVPAAHHFLQKVSQGDIYWASPQLPEQLESGIPHPYVIVQDDHINHSRIETVVGCALTSNLHRVSETPGNLLLDAGEGSLPRQSVVEVSKITTIHKSHLGNYIGALSRDRINQILAGIRFLQTSQFSR